MSCKFQIDGTPCNSHPMRGEDFCFFHNPNISDEEKKAAQARGGKNNGFKQAEPLEPIKLETIKDVVVLLAETINGVRVGSIDIRVANCLGILSGHLLKAMETSDFERRMIEIEEKMEEYRHTADQVRSDLRRHN
ncbi:MAG: hypothetical protein A2X20_00330 [Bacteroidetes bacterium GWE2_40_15]|nr:MAG: hypothetical protein A2X20_00330 [Bacteroidetes bacterium GWE2_40_15]